MRKLNTRLKLKPMTAQQAVTHAKIMKELQRPFTQEELVDTKDGIGKRVRELEQGIADVELGLYECYEAFVRIAPHDQDHPAWDKFKKGIQKIADKHNLPFPKGKI